CRELACPEPVEGVELVEGWRLDFRWMRAPLIQGRDALAWVLSWSKGSVTERCMASGSSAYENGRRERLTRFTGGTYFTYS
ncbi:MAG: hypothetical protein ACLFO5_06215, partial [Opitutales bacterium]